MKKLISLVLTVLVAGNFLNAVHSDDINIDVNDAIASGAINSMKQAADRQLANPPEYVSLTDWTMAAFYDGLIATARASGDAKYLEEVLRFGDSAGWTVGFEKAVGSPWLDFYVLDKGRKERLEQTRKAMPENLEETWANDVFFNHGRIYAKLFKETGDKKFAEILDTAAENSVKGTFDADKKIFYTTKIESKSYSTGTNGYALAGLCSILEDLPKDYKNRPFYEKLYKDLSEGVLLNMREGGAWPNLAKKADLSGHYLFGDAMIAYAFAWGVNNGFLGAEYKVAAFDIWSTLTSKDMQASYFNLGSFLMAGGQIAKMYGGKQEVSDKDLYSKAVDMYFNRGPEAFVKIEPRRADDIAWENDKCAFRMYGPALEKSVENGGIDIWGKTVDYPILSRWYDAELRHGKSYHDDHGEGKDSYSVGDRVGCGGDLIFFDGKKVRSNVYKDATVYWTKRDTLRFSVKHVYRIDEHLGFGEVKTFTMKLGDYHFSVDAQFSLENPVVPSKEMIPAFGIRLQEENAEIVAENNFVLVKDKMAGKKLLQFAWISPENELEKVPVSDLEALIKVKLKNWSYSYKAGYTFEARKDFIDGEKTEEILKKGNL